MPIVGKQGRVEELGRLASAVSTVPELLWSGAVCLASLRLVIVEVRPQLVQDGGSRCESHVRASRVLPHGLRSEYSVELRELTRDARTRRTVSETRPVSRSRSFRISAFCSVFGAVTAHLVRGRRE